MPHTLSRVAGFALVLTGLAVQVAAQDKQDPKDKGKVPVGLNRAPQLVVTHDRPFAPVRAAAFAPDASTLYVAGYDKQVWRYKLNAGKYGDKPDAVVRVPIGPGNGGAINALAVSPDGKWLAVAGRAPRRGEGWDSADDGVVLEANRTAPQYLEDMGVIYLFDPTKPDAGKTIRKPMVGVRAMAFADPSPADGPVLVTTSVEFDPADKSVDRKEVGVVRVFDATTGKQLGERFDMPTSTPQPGVAAWATGAKKDGLRVVVGWDAIGVPKDAAGNPLKDATGKTRAAERLPSKLLTWDRAADGTWTSTWDDTERRAISPLAARVKGGAVTEWVHGGFAADGTALTVRPTGGAARSEKLTDAGGRPTYPFALAAAADFTAVLVPDSADATGLKFDLRVRTPAGERKATLSGLTFSVAMRASADGRFLAVVGFADNRVEVIDVATLAVQKLTGADRGFGNVAFLEGEKVWVGAPDESPEKGGVVLDLTVEARAAAPPGKAAPKVDAAAGARAATFAKAADAGAFLKDVATAVGAANAVAVPTGQRVTAAAYLPAKPKWDADFGPLLALALFDDRQQAARIDLYDPATGKELHRLGGPALPIKALAYSGSRPLLAAAGDDGTVSVWALKGVTRKAPAIDGLLLDIVDGVATVASVREKTAAAEVFKPKDVIASIANAKGVHIPIKTQNDYASVIRGLKIGDKADVKLGNGAAVKVAVGERTGFRQPLFSLWVSTVAGADGKHDWVGWTAPGRYDASGKGGESRIGWVSATGDPARPAAFSAAAQYRKLFYTHDFIRLLLKHADYNLAVAEIPKLPEPALSIEPPAAKLRDGRGAVRAKLDRLAVSLEQLETTLDLDHAKLEWRISGPNGATAWADAPFTGGRAKLDVSKHDWTRGEHRVQVKLLKTDPDGGPAALVDEKTLLITFVPAKPALKVTVDGKDVAAGDEFKTMNANAAVGATATSEAPDGVAVTITRKGDAKAIELAAGANGAFTPEKVPIEVGDTTLLVTAKNRGAGATDDEAATVEVRVRRSEPLVLDPPAIRLTVDTDHDARTSADAPYVVSAAAARVTATVTPREKAPITAFEWKIGDQDWKPAAPGKGANSEAREITLATDGKPVEVQVRAKSKDSKYATDAVTLRFDGLPEVGLKLPSPVVVNPDLPLSGELKVAGERRFDLKVRLTGLRDGRTREFDATVAPDRTTWAAAVSLFPGENRVDYVVRYDEGRKVSRGERLAEVRLVRPPVVVGATDLNVGTGTTGDLLLAALAPGDAPPSDLRVNDVIVGAKVGAPVRVFGAALWAVSAKGATANGEPKRLDPVPAVVRNPEAAGAAVQLTVLGQKAPPNAVAVVAAPTIRLAHKGKSFSPDQALPPIGEPTFPFEIEVKSETPLTRFEIWFGPSPTDRLDPVGKVTAADAKAVPGGFVLTATPQVALRRGPFNYVRVVAVSAGGETAAGFGVSYAPPAKRVVIESVREPGGPIVEPNAAGLRVVNNWTLEVEGKVTWDTDADPIARDPELNVAFVANGVAHVPVRVSKLDPAGGKKERRFRGMVYLNTLDPDPAAKGQTRVRAELRSGDRPVDEQEGYEPQTFVAESKNPLREQRLHVVVVGIQVGAKDRPSVAEKRAFVRQVVKAVGGEIPANKPDFVEGEFVRKDFKSARLYEPAVDYARAGDLNRLLGTVRAEIEGEIERNRKDPWVNDVIVVYYHGADWVDKGTGKWLLHSRVSHDSDGGAYAARDAIRLDRLPTTHGMPVAVVNVASAATPAGDLALDLPFLRVAWAEASARGKLLDEFAAGIAQQRRTFGGVVKHVGSAASGARLAESLPPDGIGGRVVGLGGQ